MKSLPALALTFLLLISRIGFAQSPIFMPISDASNLFMQPGLMGIDYKSRLLLNQLYQRHPLGNLHSLNASYDLDLPKLNVLTGIQVSADRIGTKNQNVFFRWNIGYVLPLAEKVKMVYTFHIASAKQSFDGPSYFDRFTYDDTLNSTTQGTSTEKYFEHSMGWAMHTPFAYGGVRMIVNTPYLGQYNGSNIFLRISTNVFLGLKLTSDFGTFKPFYSYSHCGSWAGSNDFLYNKFPSLSNHNFAFNYQFNQWTTGVGVRLIKNLPTLYHAQVGIDLKQIKLTYGLGVSPYRDAAHDLKAGVLSQVSMEFDFKRSKYYHRPVFHTEIEQFPDHTTRSEHFYKDDERYCTIEYFDNGLEKSTTFFKDNQLDGAYTEMYENGAIKIEGYYKKGLKNGRWSYYNLQYERTKYEKYFMGELLESITYDLEN